jgi:hypothetical protein
MNTPTKLAIATLLILYGIVKISIGLVACFIPDKYRKRVSDIKFVKHFISADTTISGKMFDVALLIFGLYTLAHGFYLLGIAPAVVKTHLLTRTTLYLLNLGLGLLLTGYFYLVLFTSIDIPKNNDFRPRYMVEGLCSGLMFLVTFPMLLVWHAFQDHGFAGALHSKAILLGMSLLSTLIISALIVFIAVASYKEEHKEKNISDIASVVMIPLNTLA